MTLEKLLQTYVLDHPDEIAESTVIAHHWNLVRFSKFLGEPARLEHLTSEICNASLLWARDRGLADATIKGQRTTLLMLWRFAFDEEMTDKPPRIKRLKRKAKPPEAWTPREVALLVMAAQDVRGLYPFGVKRCDYWQSLILAMYSTALRLGDCLSMRPSQVDLEARRVMVVQSKTGRAISRAISDEAALAIRKILSNDRPLVWPLWGRREAFFRAFKKLVIAAGIRPGTTKYLRRSACTQIASSQGIEAASRFLDHSSTQVTLEHYIDAGQMPQTWTVPALGPLLNHDRLLN